MDDISTTSLSISLVGLIFLSAFFSSSETGMMSLNRYRLKHLEKNNHRSAKIVSKLLKRPDRLLGLILIGNNLVNILATLISAAVAERLFGEWGLAVVPAVLTIVFLLFAEVTPKTLAAVYPERIAFPASYILYTLLKLILPIVMLVNFMCNGILRLFGVHPEDSSDDHLSSDELRTVVDEAGNLIPKRHQTMLLSILDLEKASVEDIMIPRNEIIGIDLSDDLEDILKLLCNSQHTRLPVYDESIDEVKGLLHARHIINLLNREREEVTKETILEYITPVYYIPEGTPLNTQLLKFQRNKQRIGMVVDEYGEIQGLVTIDDILEEIVGEFTTDFAATTNRDIHPQDDGSYLIDGTVTIRELNRALDLDFPTDGPKTLNGLIIEYMESIPQSGTGLRISGYPMEILHIKDNIVKSIKLWPKLRDDDSQ
ncbi:HlyC/CorC family transporter [Pleionea sp. CnH1-48]|uniref:HlyC/CorC family transporter n=1 Tax=Pleionea sp. CnH1-48 TaxID=2954494 RepID=UPI002097017A|nr:HlyC/CorC family transporter [Pleionea sp. CnH1-48]MCO7225525.1 HlyC/CorC family transporter [Pleionea sp. CnH1-48]